jgi:hydroxymethylpyrimidine kinase/phosphomethylpyrimidine kinase
MTKVLSIAGSDPSGGAGIQADLKTFQALRAFGMAVPAALTVQNSRGVLAAYSVGPRSFSEQLDALLSDVRPGAVKTGMLLMPWAVRTVGKAAAKYRLKNLVVDPVMRSSSGRMLLRSDALRSLKHQLLPHALLATPNIPEAEVLAGMKIRSQGDMDFAAGKILDLGPRYVLIKGGHRSGPAIDTLYGGHSVLTFSTARLPGAFHGTGCVLSSAIAVFIARGLSVEKAVEKGKQFVERMLKKARPLGKGKVKYFQF